MINVSLGLDEVCSRLCVVRRSIRIDDEDPDPDPDEDEEEEFDVI